MLVLLIVFMVSAPLLSGGVPLDLPQGNAAPLNVEARPVTLSIDAQGRVFLGEDEIGDDEIVTEIGRRVEDGAQERVYVRGDRRVDYGRVAEIMSIITDAGYARVALVTLPPTEN